MLIHGSYTTAYTGITICPPMHVTCFLSHFNIVFNINKRSVRFTGRFDALIHGAFITAYTVITICPPICVICLPSQLNIAFNTKSGL